MTKIVINLGNCGVKTCICSLGLEHGCCSFLRVSGLNSKWTCELFQKELRDNNGVLSGPGWLQRLPECVNAEQC